ncbi:hypothetical protein ACMT1E_02710 [Sphingomonas flavalba]|uniref:hypothetical protein n=1 Tax=Sphingomonas flavalba TaxID=2559804 RepID=UPI0039E17F2C
MSGGLTRGLRLALAGAWLVLAAPGTAAAVAAGGDGLRAGAAKVDVTPAADAMPERMLGVLDPLQVRALVIEAGGARAALVSVDAGGIGEAVWDRVRTRAVRELGIPETRLLLTATHTHSAPFGPAPGLDDKIVAAIRDAARALRPARMAWGTGRSYINVNRTIIDPDSQRWWEGPNEDGPSDKTVAVLRFDTPEGAPIAVYYNYAVHAVITGNLDMISADIPGAASRYIEESLGDGAVALWSTGAAGDQNPIYFQQTYDLRAIRIAAYAARGEDIANAMPPGGQGMDRSDPRVARLMAQQRQMALSMGQMLGEEVLHVLRAKLTRPAAAASIAGAQKTVTCPGRRRTDSGRAGYAGSYVDADPVAIRLSLLRVGDVVIGGVNAELFTTIAQRFKRESPYKQTMMATLTNGSAASGYIPNETAFGYQTFEVLSSRLKPGCAEQAIVTGLVDLIGAVDGGR